jgi:hypothetical protein
VHPFIISLAAFKFFLRFSQLIMGQVGIIQQKFISSPQEMEKHVLILASFF